ncbi:dihydroorotase [Thermohalobacter berrensis]|uniref:Dihydroorotase n=1 Tax=Thermohalobacter berrensis TaxID=99594 RepID=A0A419TA59_9FIRM|nr:dihydroorotase [Thermohalobacter berrensis]RKD34348.1 hypothetical protein BET03_00505 [Thermohalobacter berrensis]
MSIIVKNGYVVNPIENTVEKLDIEIGNGKVRRLEKNINTKVEEIIDANGKYVLPGLVDIHAHFREPGYEYKETMKTGSRAASAGGYTTVCVMANTNPVIDNVKVLKELKEIIKKDSCINVLPIASATKGLEGKEITDIKGLQKNGAIAISDDGKPIMDAELLNEIIIKTDRLGIPLMIHSEDMRYVNNGCINKGKVSEKIGVRGIDRDAENAMIERDLKLAKKLGCRIHICHVSTKESVRMIRKAKKDGVKVTCEVAPHHFSITEDLIKEKGSLCKVNPPLRTKKDIEEIIEGIKDGTIDAIATDHAPHSKEEKQLGLSKAPFGISGIELAFSITVTYLLKKGIINIVELAKLMSFNPSSIIGINRGKLKAGNPADITIVDLNESFIVEEKDLFSKGKNTPFVGEKLTGKVKWTIVSGKIVYRG